MAGDGTPIIIKKKKSHAHGHHGGSWKVAYADFVTAMMAFFMVMWILGLSDESQSEISGYFNDPFGYAKTTPFVRNIVRFPGVPVTSGGTIKKQKADVAKNSKRAVIKVQTEVERRIEKMLKQSDFSASSGIGKSFGEGGEMPGINGDGTLTAVGSLKELLTHIDVVVTDEGLRIEFLEDTSKNIFFNTGSATLKPEAIKIIRMVADVLKVTDRPLRIEGHTDARQYQKGATYNNWDLSSDRANSLRQALEKAGISSRRFEGVAGYADTKLKLRAYPLDGKNRRVAILLPTAATEDLTDPLHIGDIGLDVPEEVKIKPTIDVDSPNAVQKQGEKPAKTFWQRTEKEHEEKAKKSARH